MIDGVIFTIVVDITNVGGVIIVNVIDITIVVIITLIVSVFIISRVCFIVINFSSVDILLLNRPLKEKYTQLLSKLAVLQYTRIRQ